MRATPATTLSDLIDRAAIGDLVDHYAHGVDRRDWALYRSVFAQEVIADFAWSGVVETMAADDWVALVARTLAPFDATHHRISNYLVALDGDRAQIRAQMIARHMLGEETHAIGGFYTHDVIRTPAGWRIARLALTITWEQGDRALFERAAALGARPRGDVGAQGMA
ncbi:nuclear transport factor 2 family protein [Sphingomonas sp. 1P06PA]|uniref:nuclear transport factor 2 family protein n=1 Tax=Sphingomonas sp. 1P06PA TaxID=554121 RepID=UPI0039A51933